MTGQGRMRALYRAGIVAIAVDQISKYAVMRGMGLDQIRAIDVLPPFLNLRYGENRGVNFGLFDGDSDMQRWLLIGFSVLVMVAIFVWVWRSDAPVRVQVSAGFLIGGALGNVLDRMLYGYVQDFLNMSCCGIANPFVFNIADVFIFIGAVGLVFLDGRAREKVS